MIGWFERSALMGWSPTFLKALTPSPELFKQTREVPAGTETSNECQGSTPQFQSSIFSFLWKKGQVLAVVVVPSDSPGPCCMTCTQDFWLQVPQYFRCGNARPVGWLATEMPLHWRRQSWWCPHCFTHSLLLLINDLWLAVFQEIQRWMRHSHCLWGIFRDISSYILRDAIYL